ncbi:MAG: hypothetical protein LRY66_05130, partial [Saccharospirillaceae bacterium]|nr:hypothetical protein [Saccharospirillaceae bacterium]MCD8530740.1 hypothetical protein [Saccharospirillaceae bacterium]
NAGLCGKLQSRLDPLDRDILGKGRKVREVEQVTQIKQGLLKMLKKSGIRVLIPDFRKSPFVLQMLK